MLRPDRPFKTGIVGNTSWHGSTHFSKNFLMPHYTEITSRHSLLRGDHCQGAVISQTPYRLRDWGGLCCGQEQCYWKGVWVSSRLILFHESQSRWTNAQKLLRLGLEEVGPYLLEILMASMALGWILEWHWSLSQGEWGILDRETFSSQTDLEFLNFVLERLVDKEISDNVIFRLRFLHWNKHAYRAGRLVNIGLQQLAPGWKEGIDRRTVNEAFINT